MAPTNNIDLEDLTDDLEDLSDLFKLKESTSELINLDSGEYLKVPQNKEGSFAVVKCDENEPALNYNNNENHEQNQSVMQSPHNFQQQNTDFYQRSYQDSEIYIKEEPVKSQICNNEQQINSNLQPVNNINNNENNNELINTYGTQQRNFDYMQHIHVPEAKLYFGQSQQPQIKPLAVKIYNTEHQVNSKIYNNEQQIYSNAQPVNNINNIEINNNVTRTYCAQQQNIDYMQSQQPHINHPNFGLMPVPLAQGVHAVNSQIYNNAQQIFNNKQQLNIFNNNANNNKHNIDYMPHVPEVKLCFDQSQQPSINHANIDVMPVPLIQEVPTTPLSVKSKIYNNEQQIYSNAVKNINNIENNSNLINTFGVMQHNIGYMQHLHVPEIKLYFDQSRQPQIHHANIDIMPFPLVPLGVPATPLSVKSRGRPPVKKSIRNEKLSTGRLPCTKCDRSFSKSSYLNQHLITHQNLPYKCKKCGKKFLTETELDTHAARHYASAKPFKCGECVKQFCYNTDLRRHEISHRAIKPHVCDICYKGFARKDHMNKHKETHRDKN